MSAEEDEEIFEITDFTNATPWESFVSSIEKILHQWGLTASTYSSDSGYYPQHRKSEKLSYVGHNFVVTLHVSAEKKRPSPKQIDQDWPNAMVHMMDESNDFPPNAHHISRWYGIDQFILITPDEKSEAITTEAQVKLLSSSISLAITNTGCDTPILVQIQKKWRHMYIGQCEGCGLRTMYDMIHLKRTPLQYNHLSGLLRLFRSKLRGPAIKSLPISIAARFTYILRHWNIQDWPIESLGENESRLKKSSLVDLPVGSTVDPIQELHLSAIWPHLTEETIIDNATNTGFDPFLAPSWSIKTNLLDSPGLLLNQRLTTFMKICYRHDTFPSLLGNKLLHEDVYTPGVGSSDFSHALTKLTSSSSISSPISFSSVVYSTSQRLELGSEFEPISEREQDTVLEYLFPDSVPDNHHKHSEPQLVSDNLVRQIKSAPPDSLTGRLAKTLCTIHIEYGLKAVAHVWYEVIQELRYRWESGITIAGLSQDSPDMLCCLLHQKLQMLNNCIRHKVSHTQKLHFQPSSLSKPSASTRGSSTEPEYHSPVSSLSFSQRVHQQVSKSNSPPSNSSDDEFYEAQEALDSDQNGGNSEPSTDKDKGHLKIDSSKNTSELSTESPSLTPKKLDLEPTSIDPLSSSLTDNIEEEIIQKLDTSHDRSGALEQCKDLLLLATGEPLFVPETQEPTPLTEDMLWEQQHVLSNLGTTQEAAQVRAKMQSISLISDMQAFKAANPGCLLEDFVRWYSPRDWIEGDVSQENEEEIVDTSTDGWELDDDINIESNTKGQLSLRMRQPGNMWVESWENAMPIPAYKQKRLFDDTKEAEKVLHYLSALKPCELVLMLLPCLVHLSILALQRKLEIISLPTAQGYLQDAINMASTVQRVTLDSLPIYQECIGLLEKTEHDIATAYSLQLKLQQGLELNGKVKKTEIGQKELVTSAQLLLEEPELVLQDPISSITGCSFQGLLSAQLAVQNLENKASLELPSLPTYNNLLKPTAREFILRSVSSQPSQYSSSSPQRMFSLLTKDEMRIAGAFSYDIMVT